MPGRAVIGVIDPRPAPPQMLCQQRFHHTVSVQPGRGAGASNHWRDRVRQRSGPRAGDPLCETGHQGILPYAQQWAHARSDRRQASLHLLWAWTPGTATWTPPPSTSAPITIGTIGSTSRFVLPRRPSPVLAHAVPYRANTWSCARLVRRAFAVGAWALNSTRGRVPRSAGRPHQRPRRHLFRLEPMPPSPIRTFLRCGRGDRPARVLSDGGTMVVIQGLRFSTRSGKPVVRRCRCNLAFNMTGHP